MSEVPLYDGPAARARTGSPRDKTSLKDPLRFAGKDNAEKQIESGKDDSEEMRATGAPWSAFGPRKRERSEEELVGRKRGRGRDRLGQDAHRGRCR